MPDRKSRQHLPTGFTRESLPRASDHQEDDVYHVVQRSARCHLVRAVPPSRFQRRDAPRYHNDDPHYRVIHDFDIWRIHHAPAEIPKSREEAEEQ